MTNSSVNFMKNRKKVFNEQFNYWINNPESGVLRLVERILLGFNVSDVLGGNLEQIQHINDVKTQIKERFLLEGSVPQVHGIELNTNPIDSTSAQYLFQIENAKVDVLTGLIVLDSGFVVDSVLAKWQKIIFRGGIGSSIKRTKRARFKLFGSYVVLPHSPYYYHTVIDELPNLIQIRKHNDDCKNVIVHSLTPRWAFELLEFFDFTVTVLNRKAVVAEKLFTISAPRAVVKKNLELLRHNIKMNPSEVLVVSRKGAPRANNLIESAILNQIPNAKLIDPSDLSIAEQIRIFSSAKLVIGLHGGALTNVIWMSSSGMLIEVFNHVYRTADYERLCAELGIDYLGIEAVDMEASQVALSVRRYLDESSR